MVGRDGGISPDGDRAVLPDTELDLVTLLDPQRASDLFRQRELRLGPKPRPDADRLRPGGLACCGSAHSRSLTRIQLSDFPTLFISLSLLF
jgi:hypothetical protein